jgi:hypothetical protein
MSFGVVRLVRFGVVVGVVGACAGFAGAGEVSAASLPNACTLLTNAHPEQTLHKDGSVIAHRVLHKYGSGEGASQTCSETIGTQSVNLSLSLGAGGFGGVKVVSTTHPGGLGSGDSLIVGSSPSGGAVDFVEFHKGTIFADLSANGASPSGVTTVARRVYKLLP